eukprot:TRINITY_DN7488_c0_g2_i4.p1 TRINITY_DN7488_c0_g2~~TRINITY_DN7488_c0_g2_i4.p1  ORF type:complete len:175 (-),score=37.44 TRINITY_DN7488_c0_g2_i4:92-616(-)
MLRSLVGSEMCIRDRNVTRCFHLKKNFEIVAALRNERSRMKASGAILGIDNYSLTPETFKMCNENDCMVQIDLYIHSRQKDTIYVQFKKASRVNLGDTLFTVDKVNVYGYAPQTNSIPYAYAARSNLGRSELKIKNHRVVTSSGNEQVYVEFTEPTVITEEVILEIKFKEDLEL